MKKKLLSLLLAMVMIVGTLSGCGNKTGNSYSSVVRDVYDIETGAYESELILTIDNASNILSMLGLSSSSEIVDYLVNDKDQIKASIKVDGSISSRNPVIQSMNFSYKAGKMSDYQKFTEVIVDNETVYINLQDAIDAVAVYVPEIKDEITLDKEYLSITATEAENYLGYTAEVDTTAFGDAESVEEILQETVFYVIEVFEKASKETDLFEKSDDGYALRLDEDNLADVAVALVGYLKENSESIFDGYVEVLEKIDGDNTELIEQIKDGKDEFIEEVSEMTDDVDADELDEEIKSSGVKFAIDSYIECTGKDGKRVAESEASLTVEYQGVSAKVKMITTLDESADDTVNIPSSDVTYTLTELSELVGSMTNVDDYLDDFDFEDDDFDFDDEDFEDDDLDLDEDETYEMNPNPVANTTVTPDKNLSSDIESGQVQISGKVITLPATYKDITDLGWTLAEDFSDSDVVAANDFEFVYFEKDDSIISVAIYNNTDEELAYSECEVWDIYVSESYFDEPVPDVCLAAGIQIGSTYNDVLAAYGKPDYEFDYYSSISYSYILDKLSYSITVDYETGLVTNLSIEWYDYSF